MSIKSVIELNVFLIVLKLPCCIATRYDKLDCRYEAFVTAASILIWLA
jgi:hypothetical protein